MLFLGLLRKASMSEHMTGDGRQRWKGGVLASRLT